MSNLTNPVRDRPVLSDVVSETDRGVSSVSLTHGGRWPNDTEVVGGPYSTDNAPIGKGVEPEVLDAEWFRRMADLNKEFTDNSGRPLIPRFWCRETKPELALVATWL